MPFGSTPLNDGHTIPQIAFGTGTALFGKDATSFVAQALENGYNHIDTAQVYRNEESVGQALRESGLAREEVYITTKYGGGNIRDEFEQSLKRLGVSYVDLYLIHNPAFVRGRIPEAWAELERIKSDGLARSIGVSNFDVRDLEILLQNAKVVPAVNQIRFHPYNYAENVPLLEFSAKHGIVLEAYSSLTSITRTPGGPVDEPVQRAAHRLQITPAQVLLSWVHSKGIVIVTTSSKKKRLEEYLAVADLPPLTKEEINAIEVAGRQGPTPFRRLVARNIGHAVAGIGTIFVLARWLGKI